MKTFLSARPTVALGLVLLACPVWPGCGSEGGSSPPPAGGNTGGAGTGGRGGGAGGSPGTGGSASGGAPGSGGAPSGGSDAGATGGAPAGSGGSGGGGTDGPPASGGSSKLIKLDTTAAGAAVMGDVPAFPVAISLDGMSFDFSKAKSKGEDIRFEDGAGKALPFEIELWDATAKRAAIWVKVDVKGNAAQMIKMTWGDPNAMPASNGAAVFDAKEGFMGVWHLSEPGSTAADAYKDSTSNAGHAKGVAVTAESTGPGRIGNAILLASAQRQWAEVSPEKSVLKPEKMTYSIWFNAKSHTIAYQCMFSKGEGDFRLHYVGLASYYGNKHITENCLESATTNDVCPVDSQNGTDAKPGTWFHILAVHDQPETLFYVNGKLEAKLTAPGAWKTDSTRGVTIGNNASSRGRPFDGFLDEARLMLVAKDANWVKLEYESQREGQKFSSFVD
jgi:hypothetical protein